MTTFLITILFLTIKGCKFDKIAETIVVRVSSHSENKIQALLQRHRGFSFKNKFQIGDKKYIQLNIDQPKENVQLSKSLTERFSRLAIDKEIEMIEHQVRRLRVKKSNNIEWINAWHLNGEVQPTMRVSEAWSLGYTGRGIVIAVVDDGIQTNHPDLFYVDTVNDYDYFDNDDDPNPVSVYDSHGTEISGLIAAEKDNNYCTVGVGYNSTLIGVRILGASEITDAQEAQGLNHKINTVDVYSCSWGPPDGYGFFTPGTLALEAFEAGIKHGRNGKGAIYVWAAGNGETNDNCNGDGYVNSIYTIAITGVQSGKNAYYSEVCPAALAATYGGSNTDRYLTSTITNSSCQSEDIEGTSYACPQAAGIIALALQANNNLTWRDVQHLIVLTSKKHMFNDTYAPWQTNGASKQVSQVLGFGLMDAEAMVRYALLWSNVPKQESCVSPTSTPFVSTVGNMTSTDVITISSSLCSLTHLEHVTVNVSFQYNRYRGLTELFLISPSGTESHLLTNRGQDAVKNAERGNLTWTYMSVHYWGENPIGNWTLKVRSHRGFTVVTLDSWFLTLYGTKTNPLQGVGQCAKSPCFNNGVCTNVGYNYTCKCLEGYDGTTCELKLKNGQYDTLKETSSKLIVAIWGTVMSICVIIILILAIIHKPKVPAIPDKKTEQK